MPLYAYYLLAIVFLFVIPFRWAWAFPLLSFVLLLLALLASELDPKLSYQLMGAARFQFLFVVTVYSLRYGIRVFWLRWLNKAGTSKIQDET